MTQYLNHIYKLTIQAVDVPEVNSTETRAIESEIVITDLQIKGTVKAAKKDDPTQALLLDIYNLSDKTVDLISQERASIRLEVGYPDIPLKVLFLGNVNRVETKGNGTDRVTSIQAIEDLSNLKESTVAQSFDYDVTVGRVIEKIVVDDMGLALGNIHNGSLKSTEGLGKVLKKYSATGQATKVMDDLTRAHNLTWQVSKGQVHVYPKGEGRSDLLSSNIPLYKPDTGLLSFPNRAVINGDTTAGSKDNKIAKTFTVILNPALLVGGYVRIESRNYSEEVLIKNLNHKFDYWEGVWSTTIIGEVEGSGQ